MVVFVIFTGSLYKRLFPGDGSEPSVETKILDVPAGNDTSIGALKRPRAGGELKSAASRADVSVRAWSATAKCIRGTWNVLFDFP
jgi:hypothetical protein